MTCMSHWFDLERRSRKMTGKLERLESWNYRKAGTNGKLELPESWNYRKAGTKGKLELPESWNDRKAGTPEKTFNQNDRRG